MIEVLNKLGIEIRFFTLIEMFNKLGIEIRFFRNYYNKHYPKWGNVRNIPFKGRNELNNFVHFWLLLFFSVNNMS